MGRLSGTSPLKGPHLLYSRALRVSGIGMGQKAGKVGLPDLLLGASQAARRTLASVLLQKRGTPAWKEVRGPC